ncbi:MAG TPA: hypothetical protein VMB03_19375 [Bryobacteraceae bacterium]|nr:hypothetical protein [Bryobacteraceae bacterium]
MVDTVKRFDYEYAVIGDDPVELADVVSEIAKSGVDLLALSESAQAERRVQVELITGETAQLANTAREHGWKLRPRKSGFLVQGQGSPDAIGPILRELAASGIQITAMQVISAGSGRFGAILWVKPEDVERAGAILSAAVFDPVEESSEESFPASDAPAWASR